MKTAVPQHTLPKHEETNQFIGKIEIRFFTFNGGLSYSLARYHRGNFIHGLFQTLAINFPTRLRGSVPKRQAEFLAGRICARSALSRHSYGEYQVGIGRLREPIWPPHLVGSITHNDQYAAAIVESKSRFTSIGIDVETLVAEPTFHALAGLVVSKKEMSYLYSKASHLDLNCLLTIVFSVKESFFKAAFEKVKRYFGFDAVEVIDIDIVARTLQLRVTQTLCQEITLGKLCNAHYEFLDSNSILTVIALGIE